MSKKDMHVYIVMYEVDGTVDIDGVYLWEDDADKVCDIGSEMSVGNWFVEKHEVIQ